MHSTPRVSPEWLATEDRYAITYRIGNEERYFKAGKLGMATICKKIGWIKRSFVGVTTITVTTWDPENPDEEIQISLLKMVRGWNQRQWIDFITLYEQSKMLGQEFHHAKDKYQVA